MLLALAAFVLLLYVGPSFLYWLFGGFGFSAGGRGRYLAATCVDDKLLSYETDLSRHDAHSLHSPWRPEEDRQYLPYVGNGYVGMAAPVSPVAAAEDDSESAVGSGDAEGRILIFGGQRHLGLPVPMSPVVRLAPTSSSASSAEVETGAVVHYTKGVVHSVACGNFGPGGGSSSRSKVTVTSQIYAHRFKKTTNIG